jgi:hypothetical protein
VAARAAAERVGPGGEVVGDAAADALAAPFVLGTADALRDLVAPVFPDGRVAFAAPALIASATKAG